jgi:glycosyltransferase involved in cell wall biosynthesis
MKLLTLSTFPCDKPRHGGQHRVHNIAKHYASLGLEVVSAGVLGSRDYDKHPNFAEYPDQSDFLKVISAPAFMDDWAIGKIFASSDSHFESLVARIPLVPDVIHVEQPWLFEFALRYRKFVGRKTIKLIYGSQNVEHRLKRSILSHYLSEADAERGVEQVHACEMVAIRNADAICCVSQEDLSWTKQLTTATCVLAPNGVGRRELSPIGLDQANVLTGHKKFAFYCASAHPPNIVGFFDLFSAGLGSIAPDQLLVVAGGVGQHLASHQLADRAPGLRAKMKVVGEVDEPTLQGLIDTAHAIVLPITQGEGTNLKTAEALWAGKYVVATEKAMRGFEQFSGSTGVSMQNAPIDFLQALQRAMRAPTLSVSESEMRHRSSVLWEHSLHALSDLVVLEKT